MTPELAQAALTFLMRTDIKGAEAETFLRVCMAIKAIGEEAARKNTLENEG
jgi:hypothetical protein